MLEVQEQHNPTQYALLPGITPSAEKDLLGPSFSFETLHTEGDYIPRQLLHVWILPFPSASLWLENPDGDMPLTTVCFGGLRAKKSFTRTRGSGAFLSAYRRKHKPLLLD